MLLRPLGLLLIRALAPANAAAENPWRNDTAAEDVDGGDSPWVVSKQAACDGKEVRYSECKREPCDNCAPVDCKVAPWSDWSDADCTGLCMRQRGVQHPNNHCGKPCSHSIIETKECLAACKQTVKCEQGIDCEWDDWSDWSACTCSCGGGQKTRDRHIKVSPEGNGKKCSVQVKSEMVPCHTHPCGTAQCVDGMWGDWGQWGECSASCGGGLKWRVRRIVTEASQCGRPAVGEDRQIAYCSSQGCRGDADCRFDDWGAWGACSCSCDGVKHRSRSIGAYGRGNGKWCRGDTKEVAPCNKTGETDGCFVAAKAVDCQFSDWGEWGPCSASCGPGQRLRERKVIAEAQGGGRACAGSLRELARCEQASCSSTAVVVAKPCIWGIWQEWSSCDKCGGQRKRFRLILQMPEDGGAACKPEASEETSKCPRECERSYCTWGPWDTGECSVSCGIGSVRRVRYLVATETPPETLSMYQDIAQPAAAAAGAGGGDDREGLLLGLSGGCLLTLLAQWSWRKAQPWPSAGRGRSEEEMPLYRLQARGQGGWMPIATVDSDAEG